MTRHAVISGAGIAGPALAHQLSARGWRTTVIERFPERRDEGQNIDVRGAAREVVRRMGIEADLRAANTGEVGMRFVDEHGSPAAEFPMSAPGEVDGPTAEFEILRGELSRILIDHGRDGTDYRFDTRVADLTDHGDHVTVALDDGTEVDADLVVIAEGLRSKTRRFVTQAHVYDLGMYFAYVTVPREDTDEPWWSWQHAPGSLAVHLRPDNLGTTRALLTFVSDVRGLDALQTSDQIDILRKTFADVGGGAPRILAQLDAGAPLYFSAVGQVSTPVWSRGRVALLGDAAFCNATFGGVGTSFALIGAYVLAGELSRTEDAFAALKNYERFMRDNLIDATPPVRMEVLRRANPRTPGGIRALRTVAGIAASRPGQAVVKTLGRRAGRNATGDLRLPDYG